MGFYCAFGERSGAAIRAALTSPLSPQALGELLLHLLLSCLVYTAAFLSENATFVSRPGRALERSKSYIAPRLVYYTISPGARICVIQTSNTRAFRTRFRFPPLPFRPPRPLPPPELRANSFGEFSRLIKKQDLFTYPIPSELNPLIFDIKSRYAERVIRGVL